MPRSRHVVKVTVIVVEALKRTFLVGQEAVNICACSLNMVRVNVWRCKSKKSLNHPAVVQNVLQEVVFYSHLQMLFFKKSSQWITANAVSGHLRTK